MRTVTPIEKNIMKKINQKKEGMQGLQGLALYEGRNLSNVIGKEKQKVEKMENRLANIQGKNTMKYITNPGYMGGKKTRKQRRRRMTRRRH
jgi:hypothetical protein